MARRGTTVRRERFLPYRYERFGLEIEPMRCELDGGRKVSSFNLARHLDLDAEETLRRANRKFEQRFRRMEDDAAGQGDELSTLSDEQLDHLWRGAKERPTD